MKRRRVGDSGSSYWPGYVDALTNVVLNLLFLVAIFSAGIFSMGMQAARSKLEQIREAVDVPAEPPLPPPLRITVADDAPAANNGRNVVLDGVRHVAGEPVIAIGFAATAVTVPSVDRAALEQALRPLLSDGERGVKVWAVVDMTDAVSRRAAYLRVMAIRDLLRTWSVDADHIELRLVSGKVKRGTGQTVYVLVHPRTEPFLREIHDDDE